MASPSLSGRETATRKHETADAPPTLIRVQEVLSVPNEVAAELGGIGDGVLNTLRDRLALHASPAREPADDRGGRRPGRRRACGRGRARRARRGRARDRAGHRRRSRRGTRPDGRPPRGLRGRRLAPPRQEDRAQDHGPEALRRRDPRVHRDLRDRPGRHRQDVPRDGARRRGARREAGRPDHPHAPGGRSRRAARLPARRHAREGRPVPAAALRRPLRHARRRQADRAHGARRDRGRAARVHARPHAERLVHHPRRGAEHLARSRCRCS